MITKTRSTTTTLTLAALFSVLAYLIMFAFRTPLVPVISFVKYDAKDAVLALEAVILGPVPAALSSLVVAIIEFVTVGQTGPLGMLMNIVASLTFILPVGIIYKCHRKISGFIAGLICSALILTASMLLWNYLISPYYMGVSREAISKLLIPGFLPFNLIKAAINSVITLLLFKPVMTVLKKANLLSKAGEKSEPEA